ncbi:hypothetical protein AVT10_15050 [Sphingomonas hankookensis]|uniref:Uncharacterized protein n=1 Tax=Sphingomonas hankookensis TaxID=563996 RepID=A0ABR5YE68_9SPHN|nr:hypothetical protein AVT10_15050 [Sphingomonas hankookensis]PZT95542.1 MAG: hypothetical protein DI625_02055 [Sphingomonas sp.]
MADVNAGPLHDDLVEDDLILRPGAGPVVRLAELDNEVSLRAKPCLKLDMVCYGPTPHTEQMMSADCGDGIIWQRTVLRTDDAASGRRRGHKSDANG